MRFVVTQKQTRRRKQSGAARDQEAFHKRTQRTPKTLVEDQTSS